MNGRGGALGTKGAAFGTGSRPIVGGEDTLLAGIPKVPA
jgi:hypothetical protein